MIYCVWYPAGGFGHFINSVLNSYGKNFVRPKSLPMISSNGNSHQQELVAPTYFQDPEVYKFEFDSTKNYSVLIDNGINNESVRFTNFFSNACLIKICYTDFSWPIVAKTMIIKAMKTSLEQQLPLDSSSWKEGADWALREKYFLFLRDHPLRYKWKPGVQDIVINIEDLLTYQGLRQKLNVDLEDFTDHYDIWFRTNSVYFDPVLNAEKILQGQFISTNDIWSQAVLYYQIWCRYGIEVPHNDYSSWFESHEQIVKMLDDHGVKV
jgi:hypothetical protein